MNGSLIDTNILVYAFRGDLNDRRSSKACDLLERLAIDGSGCVSAQNLSEFCSYSLNKHKPAVPPAHLREEISKIESLFTVLTPSGNVVKAALRAVERHRLSFWDALIWGVAGEYGVREILTEDFQDGAVIEGIRFRNPLKE